MATDSLLLIHYPDHLTPRRSKGLHECGCCTFFDLWNSSRSEPKYLEMRYLSRNGKRSHRTWRRLDPSDSEPSAHLHVGRYALTDMASLRDLEIHSEKSTILIFIQKQRKSTIHRCYLSRTCAHGALAATNSPQLSPVNRADLHRVTATRTT